MPMWGYLYLGNFQLQTFPKGRNVIKKTCSYMYFKVGRISFSSIEFIKVSLKQKHILSAAWKNLSAVITLDLGA